MNPKKQASPAVIVGMVAGIIAALGFVSYQLTGGGGGSPEPVKTLPAAPTVATNAAPGTTNVTAPAGTQVPTVEVAQNRTGGEAELAPGANPFVSIAKPLENTAQPAAPVVSTNPRPAPATGNVPRPGTQVLPTFPSTSGVPPMNIAGARGLDQPELAGTLIGEQPSAVFRSANRLVVVGVGGTFNGWKVVAVEHGGVKVKTDGRTVLLAVGSSGSRSAIRDERASVHGRITSDRSEYASDASQQAAAPAVTAYVKTGTDPVMPVTSEANSITQDLGVDPTGTTTTPAGQIPPAGQGDPIPGSVPVETPSTLPPAGEKGVPAPPADPPVNTEKVIPLPKDKPKDPPARP